MVLSRVRQPCIGRCLRQMSVGRKKLVGDLANDLLALSDDLVATFYKNRNFSIAVALLIYRRFKNDSK